MGVSGSAPATPAAPRNKQLAHVSDPRSPTAGILRPPIEVVSSPADSPQPSPAEPPAGTSQERDPRSPTPGISCTPMRAVPTLSPADSVDCLVKQLSEAFGAEPVAQEPAPPGAAGPAEEAARRSSPLAGGEAERPPSPSTAPARPARPAGHSFSSGKCSAWRCQGSVCPQSCAAGLRAITKPVRHKPNNKFMATSGGTGRSPLSILQDDNSPSAPVPHQGKRHMLGENLGEKKEVTVDLNRSLKSGNCAWSDLNKENQQCSFVES
ncbi:CDCA3 protein, partial [Origma solitaria]|nr:CDCA3 protein [Origma solitaria]